LRRRHQASDLQGFGSFGIPHARVESASFAAGIAVASVVTMRARRTSLSRRLEAGRIQPFIDVSGGVDLPGPSEKVIALWPRR
jgi:hypothetical protein